MKIIDKSLFGSDYTLEYVVLSILSFSTFKKIQKVENKRKMLKRKMKDHYHKV